MPIESFFGRALDQIEQVAEETECSMHLLFATLLILAHIALEEGQEEEGDACRIRPMDASRPDTAVFQSRASDVLSLVSHLSLTPSSWTDSLRSAFDRLVPLCCFPKPQEEEKERALDIAGIINANAHSIPSSPLFALYPLASMLNHSCDPNAFLFPEAESVVVRASRPILPGEEVSLSYVPLFQPRALRRRQLKEERYFRCECLRCAAWDRERELSGIACKVKACGGFHFARLETTLDEHGEPQPVDRPPPPDIQGIDPASLQDPSHGLPDRPAEKVARPSSQRRISSAEKVGEGAEEGQAKKRRFHTRRRVRGGGDGEEDGDLSSLASQLMELKAAKKESEGEDEAPATKLRFALSILSLFSLFSILSVF